MKQRSLTLAEIMISVFIFVVGVGAVFAVYPPLFEGVEITFQTMRAWGECRKEMETLKNTPFAILWDKEPYTNNKYGPKIFINTANSMVGVFYLEKILDGATVINDVLKITVSVSVKAKNRVIGEDQLLTGDPGQTDVNGNGLLDSPISLSTVILELR